jgi:hypothetical protein
MDKTQYCHEPASSPYHNAATQSIYHSRELSLTLSSFLEMAQRLTIELPPPVARIDDLADRERSACQSPKISPSRRSSNSRSFTTKPKPGALRLLFSQDVATDWWLELQLLFMTMISGILDSVTYTTYNVFTTKQTGMFVGLILIEIGSLTT